MHEAYNNLTAAFQFLLCFNVFSNFSLSLIEVELSRGMIL